MTPLSPTEKEAKLAELRAELAALEAAPPEPATAAEGDEAAGGAATPLDPDTEAPAASEGVDFAALEAQLLEKEIEEQVEALKALEEEGLEEEELPEEELQEEELPEEELEEAGGASLLEVYLEGQAAWAEGWFQMSLLGDHDVDGRSAIARHLGELPDPYRDALEAAGQCGGRYLHPDGPQYCTLAHAHGGPCVFARRGDEPGFEAPPP